MIGRPRCREWTPLATQQLRLRSLIQIVGYNIRPPEGCVSQCSFYLTLHHTTMSAPFYTSERIISPHPKWKEIDSEITQRMSSTNIVIRIWCHIVPTSNSDDAEKLQDTVIQTWGVYFSGLRYIGANLALNFTSDCFKSNTLVFQMHGGYFCSYKSLKLDIIPPENEEHSSLSSDSSGKTNLSKITLEPKFIQHQKLKESRSISPNKFNRKTDKEYSKSNSPVDRGFKQDFPNLKTSTSLNITVKNRRDESQERRNDPNYIYEHSPETLDVMSGDGCSSLKKRAQEESQKVDISEPAENYDLRNEVSPPKFRYLALNFLKSEIRHSYTANKLQKLHLLQYAIKKKQEAVQEIKERIYKKSALSNEWSESQDSEKLKPRSRSQRNLFSPEEEVEDRKSLSQTELRKNGRIDERPVSNGPRLTLKLNDLLSFKAKPSPFQRSEHVRLTKQLEILRFKRIILSDETNRKLANIRRLKEIYSKLSEENQDVGLELLQEYHTLSRRADVLKETKQSCEALRELAARSHLALAAKRADLLQQLHQIFYIEQKDTTTWTIINVPLPVCGDDSPRTLNPVSDSVAAGFCAQATCLAAACLGQPTRYRISLLGSASKILDITPDLPDPNPQTLTFVSDSVAACFCAQATCLAAACLGQPTRYRISLLGSASKILDITPDLPDPNIPLFARGGDATLFRYAMFLLNKTIAQLLWGRGFPVADMRPTLFNLQRLLLKPSNLTDTAKLFGTYRWQENQCPRTQSLRSLVASERGKQNRQFNRFKDAVDGQSPATAMNLRRHRHSKSVGSYHDDQELPTLDTSTTSIMGSEPNIYDTKLTAVPTELKTHISDSEISRISKEDNKVVFTLGDDTKLENIETQLVRISSNNLDECSTDNVTKICSEITDFCTKADKTDEGVDIAKHIEDTHVNIAKYMVKRSLSEIEEDPCKNCERNKDGVCEIVCAKNVTDVIVIPSAEAILDTGQSKDVQANVSLETEELAKDLQTNVDLGKEELVEDVQSNDILEKNEFAEEVQTNVNSEEEAVDIEKQDVQSSAEA